MSDGAGFARAHPLPDERRQGAKLLFAAAIPAGLGAPLTVTQVLVINLLTDGLPAVALSRDPGSPDAMERGPLRGNRLFSRAMIGALGGIGLLVGLASLLAFLAGRGLGAGSDQTMAFVTLAVAELGLVFSIRAGTGAPWSVARNRFLELAVLGLAVAVALAVYPPVLHEPLGTVPLGSTELAVALALAFVPVACVELAKRLLRLHG